MKTKQEAGEVSTETGKDFAEGKRVSHIDTNQNPVQDVSQCTQLVSVAAESNVSNFLLPKVDQRVLKKQTNESSSKCSQVFND